MTRYKYTSGGEGSAAPAYEVTQHDPRKRKSSHYEGSETGSGYESQGGTSGGLDAPLPAPPLPPPAPRKRKPSSYGAGNAYDDDAEESCTRQHPDKKQNHSEIEKRRRDKMNTYISELSAIVPMCGAMARKLDKLTVLRMAVQHLRVVRGALSASPLCSRARPSFLSERALNALVLQAARDTFLLVVGCDRGRILYVSASVSRMLAYQQSELLGQSLFDILHPKDVAKVKEQLSSSDLSPRERLIDAKTMLPVKADIVAGASRLSPGARRSFFARIKSRASNDATATTEPVKEEDPAKIRKKPHEKKYCVVQCTGYLKSWTPTEMNEGSTGGESGDEGEASSLSCLVAVARALPDLAPLPAPTILPSHPQAASPPARRLQFVSRHAIDGKFLFVDQRVTLALGWLPQELLGTSLYELVEGGASVGAVARAHKSALLQRAPAHTPPYELRTKDGQTKHVHTHFKPFRNPWTRDVECLVANNTVGEAPPPAPGTSAHAYELFKQQSEGVECEDAEMRRLIESHVESHKIGSAIAEEALRRFSPEFPADFSADLQDAVFTHQPSLMDNILGVEMNSYNQVRNNVPLSAAAGASPPTQPAAAAAAPHTPPPASPPLPLDGNGEAAMAVIMSLLEADAGLGGAVNFNDLPLP